MTSTTQPDDVAPADFDLDAWIAGAKPIERSVQFAGAGHLLAQADDLLRRYDLAKATADSDRGIGDETPETILAQLEQLEEQLEASRTTWYVRALTEDEILAANKRAEKAAGRSKSPEKKNHADRTAHIIAAAVTRIVTAGGATVDSVTAAQVTALRKKFGTAKVLDKLMEAIALAMSQEPSISAPFSPTSSPDHAGPAPSPSSAPPATGESPTA